jgi:hypothetical protein
MVRLPSLIVLLLLFLQSGCANDLDRERRSRIGVRGLVAAPPNKVEEALDRVVALGAYALPDIEQEFHAAPALGRQRLLRALERIDSRKAVPLLRFLAEHDTDETVRRRAAVLARRVGR